MLGNAEVSQITTSIRPEKHSRRYVIDKVEWVGNKPYAMISLPVMLEFHTGLDLSDPRSHLGKIFAIGPLAVKLIEYDLERDCYIVVRVTGWRTDLYYHAKWRIGRALSSIGSKLLWTGIIWGLVEYEANGLSPTWRDIKPLNRWFKKGG
jgi:hypothetical protein